MVLSKHKTLQKYALTCQLCIRAFITVYYFPQGYLAVVPVQDSADRPYMKQIRVCMSCARAMRGRYKLSRLPENKQFSCAMGNGEISEIKRTDA